MNLEACNRCTCSLKFVLRFHETNTPPGVVRFCFPEGSDFHESFLFKTDGSRERHAGTHLVNVLEFACES